MLLLTSGRHVTKNPRPRASPISLHMPEFLTLKSAILGGLPCLQLNGLLTCVNLGTGGGVGCVSALVHSGMALCEEQYHDSLLWLIWHHS